MNVSSVGTSQMMQMSSRQSSGSSLTDTQKALIEETLEDYDVNNLSSSDAETIVGIFDEAGIAPSAALESALAESGVDAQELGNLAGVSKGGGKGGPGGPPPPPDEEEMTTIEELLESLLAAAEEEAEEEALEESSSIADSSESSSFSTILDYTEKIVRLNDDAKSEVMELLNTYNSDENTLSQEDTQTYIMNSLRDVFSDTDNFNSFSFYA